MASSAEYQRSFDGLVIRKIVYIMCFGFFQTVDLIFNKKRFWTKILLSIIITVIGGMSECLCEKRFSVFLQSCRKSNSTGTPCTKAAEFCWPILKSKCTVPYMGLLVILPNWCEKPTTLQNLKIKAVSWDRMYIRNNYTPPLFLFKLKTSAWLYKLFLSCISIRTEGGSQLL